MNPIVAAQFKRLESAIADLREVLEANRAELAKQHELKENMLQEQWRQRRQATTLGRIAEDYDALDEENRRLTAERAELRDHLERIVKHSKALTGLYQP